MFSTLRTRFGIPGVISVIALVFAMIGGAYAASSNGGGKATASKAGKRGPRGPKGATGPTGPMGPAGANGTNGTNGKDGAPGAPGKDGTDGKSVEVTEIEPGEPECEELGGAEVKQEGAGSGVKVCSGQTGFTTTLPPGKTETGSWMLVGPDGTGVAFADLSFNIPLEASLPPSNVHYVEAEEVSPPAACQGSPENPIAAEGNLCVYEKEPNPTPSGVRVSDPSEPGFGIPLEGAAKAGAILLALGYEGIVYGTWAVTG